MNYEDAKRRARKEFGTHGHAAVKVDKVLGTLYQVGTYIKGAFTLLGIGITWEAAFEDAKKRETPGPRGTA